MMPLRPRLTLHEFLSPYDTSPLGNLVVFDSPTDAHTPVMLEAYDHLEIYLEQQVPVFYLDATTVPEDLREELLVFSVPTLLWLRTVDDKTECLMRVVGVCNKHKLELEADKVLDKILPE